MYLKYFAESYSMKVSCKFLLNHYRNGHNYAKKEPKNLANLCFFPCYIAYVIFAAEIFWALALLISIVRKNVRDMTPPKIIRVYPLTKYDLFLTFSSHQSSPLYYLDMQWHIMRSPDMSCDTQIL